MDVHGASTLDDGSKACINTQWDEIDGKRHSNIKGKLNRVILCR